MPNLKIRDRVEYADVNLLDYAGTVEEIHGQFCRVRWDRHPGFLSTQWIPNLCKIETTRRAA